ncbi:MAG: hypothetical protein KDK04_15000 [Candidatus Competibacteraceae bacterium]|nr:hypothetical protein [Candidatus Competibacteraceae bacterium]MCB1808156.1 hypothetical protein [Candidatus Competibacteraceae bacterium]MCB1813007.1 hypothetical protein [Candidatus Competibacteraceae bacterium]
MRHVYPARFLISLVLLAQFMLTVHALEHVLEHDNSAAVCTLCLAAKAQGHALGFTPTPLQTAGSFPALPGQVFVSVDPVAVYHQLIRAPPALSPVS